MKRTMFTAVLGLLLLGSTGCSTMLKQTYYAATGAQGKYYELSAVKPHELAEYRSFKLMPFSNDLGEHVPQAMLSAIKVEAPAAIEEEFLFYPSGKTLIIKGTVIHYTGKTGMKGTITNVIGDEECICRVQLYDAETEALVGDAVCWGVVKSAVRRGYDELGEGVGKGIAKWIEDRLPEPEREAREAELKAKAE